MCRSTLSMFGTSALLLALAAGCDHGQAQQTAPPQQPPPAVSVAEVISKDVPVYLDAIGKIVSTESVSIVPQVGGKVMAAHVANGAYVKKGELLFEIDPRPFKAELASAEALLAEHKAELTWAEADFKRTEELLKTNVASQLEFEQKKSAVDVTRAKIDSANAAREQALLRIEYCQIKAPLDGRAGARLVDEGNVVKENDGVMLVIQRIDPIYAEFTVTENDLGTVRKFMAARGMPVGREESFGLVTLVDVPGDSARIVSSLGNPSTQPGAQSFSEAREGKLTFLDNTVQTATGTVRLRATVPNSDLFFWPGQFVNVRLIVTVKKDAALIPLQAQQVGQQGPFVYVVREGQIEDPQTKTTHPATVAELRPLVLGQRQGDLLVVESGVSSGERVIVSGHMMVAPGGPVTVVNGAPTAPPATQPH